MDNNKYQDINTGDCLEVNWNPDEFWEMLTDYTHEEDFEKNFKNDNIINTQQNQRKEEPPKPKTKRVTVPERNTSGLTLFPVGKPVPKTKFEPKYDHPEVCNPGPKPINIQRYEGNEKKNTKQRGGKRSKFVKQIKILEELIKHSNSDGERKIHTEKLEETKNCLNRLKKGKNIKIKI